MSVKKVSWTKIVKEINQRNLLAAKELDKEGIKPLSGFSPTRNYSAISKAFGSSVFSVSVKPEEFIYKNALWNGKFHVQIGGMKVILVKNLDGSKLETQMIIPWKVYNGNLMDLQIGSRHKLRSMIKIDYLKVLKEYLGKTKRYKLMEDIVYPFCKILCKKKYCQKDKDMLNKLAFEWEMFLWKIAKERK